jgi:hypothetical protein
VKTCRSIPATPPEDVAKVIAQARAHSAALGLYLWLVMITGQRRGELCGLQIRDVDLDQGLIHVAFNYVVKGPEDPQGHQDSSGPLAGHRPGHMRADRGLPGRSQGHARGCGRQARRGCVPVLQRPRPHPAMEPGLGDTPHR